MRRGRFSRRAAALAAVTAATFGIGQSAAGAAGEQAAASLGAAAAIAGDGQHPGGTDHLPQRYDEIELVSKLRLTGVAGGIADVAAFGRHAYLAAWSPECTGANQVSKGGGVHVVDLSDPANPRKVAFAPAPANTYVGEGVHVFHMETAAFKGDVLLMNHEGCDTSKPYPGGFSAYDVTDPANPKPLVLGAGEPKGTPDPNVADAATSHSAHSVQGWWTGTNAYLVLVDNQDLDDIDIFDITDPAKPKMIGESGFEDYPEVHTPLENGNTVFVHDAQVKQIDGRWLMQVSYWDAGYITLDVTDPANPKYVADTDPPRPDPLSGQLVPEGNAHQSYWSHDNRFIIAADEDFSPFRTLFQITNGPHQGPQSAGEFGWTVPVDEKFPNGLSGPTIFGGSGCDEDTSDEGTVNDRDEVPPASELEAAEGEAKIVVFARGTCFFSKKVESGQLKGYDAVLIGNSHAGSRNGLLPEAFICGSKGHEFTTTVSALCIGHKAMHNLFEDPENYTGTAPDIERGVQGAKISASTAFDGWGGVHLLDAKTLKEIDAYAIPEAYDERFASGFGDLSVHESKTDPTESLAYFAYYAGGVRVARFGTDGIEETGAFIDAGGNDFWGIAPVTLNNERLLLASDRDTGLYVLRYRGPGAPKPPACESQRQFVDEGRPEELTLVCTDANGNPLALSIADATDNGTLSAIAGGKVTYTPRAGFRGEDSLTFQASDGSLVSAPATVRLIVGGCSNRLAATEGPDLLAGTTHGDAVNALGGDDRIATGPGVDCMTGDAGHDELDGGAEPDQITGGRGTDRLFGGPGADELRGNEDRDHVNGGSGDDRIGGDAGDDFLAGGSDDDVVSGGSGRDSIRGEAGNDRITGGSGDDTINAGKGRNRVSAGGGRDTVYAVNGSRDVISCGSGRDSVRADRKDRVSRSCERVRRTRLTRRG